jgi:hypothetical protein
LGLNPDPAISIFPFSGFAGVGETATQDFRAPDMLQLKNAFRATLGLAFLPPFADSMVGAHADIPNMVRKKNAATLKLKTALCFFIIDTPPLRI